jgi:hypothetical protein
LLRKKSSRAIRISSVIDSEAESKLPKCSGDASVLSVR